MMQSRRDQAVSETMEELTEFEQGFVSAVLAHMGIGTREPTMEEFVLALGELEAFAREHAAQLPRTSGWETRLPHAPS